MSSSAEEILHLMMESQREPVTHYHPDVTRPLPHGLTLAPGESVSTTPDPDMVTCEECQP